MSTHRHHGRPPRPQRNRSPRPLSVVPPDGQTGSSGPPRTLTVRTEADLLAVVPTSFGFHPEESLVMMVVGRDGHPMFARVDLPAGPDEADAAAAEFVQAAVVNRGESVVLIAYTDDEDAAFRAIVHVVGDLADAGFGLMIAMRADGRRWYRVLPGPEDLEGVLYDLESHPITAAAVMAGQVTHARRDDLAQSLLPRDPDLVDAVAVAHAALPAVDADAMPAEARWLDDWVTARLETGEGMGEVDPDDVARVVRDLAVSALNEVAGVTLDRAGAAAHVRLWTDVVRHCPLDLLAPAAGVLALASWLEGHGAMAWCAIDRALQSDPDCTMARSVGQLLEAAVPPSVWEPGDRGALSLLRR